MADAIDGLLGSSDGGDTLIIGSGSADDSTNTVTITIPSGQTRTVSVTSNGPGGLDTGSIAPNTMYALYVVRNDSNGNVAGMLSLKFTGFSWSGAKWRRVGSVLTNANSQIVEYTQTGSGASRQVSYNANPNVLKVLAGASAANWTEFSLAPPKPPVNGTAHLEVTPSGGTTALRAGAGGSEFTITVPTTIGFTPPLGTNRGDFRTPSGTTTVRVTGYTETV